MCFAILCLFDSGSTLARNETESCPCMPRQHQHAKCWQRRLGMISGEGVPSVLRGARMGHGMVVPENFSRNHSFASTDRFACTLQSENGKRGRGMTTSKLVARLELAGGNRAKARPPGNVGPDIGARKVRRRLCQTHEKSTGCLRKSSLFAGPGLVGLSSVLLLTPTPALFLRAGVGDSRPRSLCKALQSLYQQGTASRCQHPTSCQHRDSRDSYVGETKKQAQQPKSDRRFQNTPPNCTTPRHGGEGKTKKDPTYPRTASYHAR